MKQKESVIFIIAWISLEITGGGIAVFGLITALWPGSSDTLFLRAIGMASIGMGLFGVMITVIPFRRGERWAWLALWYYPIFWLVHLIGDLPPGKDRIHQVVFIVLSLLALVISVWNFFPPASRTG